MSWRKKKSTIPRPINLRQKEFTINTYPFGDRHKELIRHRFAAAIEKLYDLLKGNRRRLVAGACFRVLEKIEGGTFRSATLRKLMQRDYNIEIGCHSYGEMFIPGAFAPSVTIGKYVSVAKGVRVFTQNHPIDHLSTHPYFYESKFGIVETDTLAPATTTIGHDVWIGQNAVLLPGCQQVGHGAIIGAGAVVTKNVPNYAVVAGNPAKIIKYRFDEPTIVKLLELEWWHKSRKDLETLPFTKDAIAAQLN